MELGGIGTLRDLAKLLNDADPNHDSDHSDTESTEGRSASCKLGPGSVGTPKKIQTKSNECDAKSKAVTSEKIPNKNNKNIWTDEEAECKAKGCATLDLSNDPREQPKFETYYRQSVGTEDIYLQMGNKTPCTASCENLVVVIDLPGEDFRQVKLDIRSELLFLRGPKYIFRFPLPHPVDPNAGNAKWDQDKEKLTITLMLSRELDALNF